MSSTSAVRLRNRLLCLFYQANQLFLAEDMDNIVSDVAERNLCSLLAQKMSGMLAEYGFSEYKVDVEYNRNGGKIKTIVDAKAVIVPITCDLIIHSRGHKQKDNLFALEMKKLPCGAADLASDRNRLTSLTKHEFFDTYSADGVTLPEHVCDYEVGVFYLLDIARRKITLEIYSDGQLTNVETAPFEYFESFSIRDHSNCIRAKRWRL